MGDVYSQTHIGEMESITQADKSKSDDVMSNQLLEILTRLLQLQHQDDCLLRPITSFKKIVGLEACLMLTMGETLKHSGGIEVPKSWALHDI